MVNDLVAKILDDDCSTSNDVFSNHCNGNPQQYPTTETPLTEDCKIRLANNTFTNGYHATYPQSQILNASLNFNGNDQEFRNICSGLDTLSLNVLCRGQQTHDKGVPYANGYINNIQRYFGK